MARDEYRIEEIISLRSKDLKTGRPRSFKPEDFTNGEHWQKLVEEAELRPKHFEIRRKLIQSAEAAGEDLSKIPLSRMTHMSRERVAKIAEHYGIMDKEQTRSSLIDQIAAEKQKEEEQVTKFGPGSDDTSDDEDPGDGQ